MKKCLVIGLFAFGIGSMRSWAGTLPNQSFTPPDASSTTVPTPEFHTMTSALPEVSTAPVVSSTAPAKAPIPDRPLTERAGPDIFVSLTRKAFLADELPTNTAIVKPDEFRLINAQNAGEAIANQAGVQTRPIGQTGSPLFASIRGTNSDEQTLVLVDGRPYQGFALGPADLSEIPIESIDHIEIMRGGASALYGPDAVGGVINVITKRATYPGKPISNFSLTEGQYGYQGYRLDMGSRYGPMDYFFYGDQRILSGFRDNSDWRGYNVGGNFGLSMGKAGKFLFDASTYHQNAGIPGPAYGAGDPSNLSGTTPYLMPNQFNNSDEKFASSPSARKITDTNYLRTSYILPLPGDSLMALRLFGSQRQEELDDQSDPNPLLVSQTLRQEQSHGGELQFNLPAGFTAGGSFIFDRETFNDQITPANSFITYTEDYGVFAQDEIHYGRLKLIPGIRYDQDHAGVSTNPRMQMVDDVTDNLRLNASAAHSFRAPSIDELNLFTPFFNSNPELKPEKAWTFDGGFEVHNASNSFRTTYFFSNISDLIQTIETSPDVFNVQNVGKARRQGVEAELADMFNSNLSNTLNYTFMINQGIPDGFSDYVPLAFSPHHTANDTLSVKWAKRWRADFTGRYEDSRYSGNDNSGNKLGSQYVQDVRLAYQLRQMELYAGVADVFDKRYEEQPGFPLPGRTFFGGFNLKLWE
jgi:outer membrane receptor protein involved in Fe transport